MADEQFNSQQDVDVKAGFDASKLKGRSVVVTGGASGLGEEMVRQFVKAGAFVTIGDLSEERASSIANELGKYAATLNTTFSHRPPSPTDHQHRESCTYAQTDVLSWSSQLALFKHALTTSPTGKIDIVVANAGISGQDQVWRTDEDASEPSEPDLSILKVNLVAVHYTAKLAAYYLSRNNDSGADRILIMTASLAGYLDMPGAPQYGASKWGVRGLMHSLRRTMPDQGIRVNIIAPWFIRTPIMSDQVQDLLTKRGIDFAEKADAAKAVLHFSADSSINGRTFAILPRGEGAEEGYKDLCLDDYNEGDFLTGLQRGAVGIRHRIEAK